MFPTDAEFLLIYIAYLTMALILVFGLIFHRSKRFFAINGILFLLYFAFMVNVFMDPDNFSGGASLVVMFYAAMAVLGHYFILLISLVVYALRRRKRR